MEMTADSSWGGISNRMVSLVDSWAQFFSIVFSPDFMLLSILIGTKIYIISNHWQYVSGVPQLLLFLVVLISLGSACLGASFVRRYSEIGTQKVMKRRAENAIHSLKMILLNANKSEKVVSSYLDDLQDTADVESGRKYTEIIARCKMLQEEVLHAIESWKDVCPDADVTGKVSHLNRLQGEKIYLETQVNSVKSRIQTEKHQDEHKEATQHLVIHEKKLKAVNKALEAKQAEINSSVLSGIPFLPPVSSGEYNCSLTNFLNKVEMLEISSGLKKVAKRKFAAKTASASV